MVSEMRMNNCRVFTSGEDGRRKRHFPPAKSPRSWSCERGSVTIMTSVLLVGLVLVIGLSIDVSRIYMVRTGLQNAADAAALAAARELNSGPSGLTDAVTQAQAAALQANKYGLNRTGAVGPNVTISKVEFAPNLNNGPWYDGAAAATGVASTIKYVRVTTQAASVSILFAAKALGSSHIEQRTAVAGMSVPLNEICNFFPVAIALTNLNLAAHAAFTATYKDGTGSSITLGNQNYTVIDVAIITGNGAPETANLAAGIPTICASLGDVVALSTSPSANSTNGPKQIADGANTRMDTYRNGYANSLNPTTYPPDTNIYDMNNPLLTDTQYLAKSPLSPPTNPGQDDRRILVMPLVSPGTYSPTPGAAIKKFGAFLMRHSVSRSGANAGDLQLEYLGDDFVVPSGFYNPNNPCVLLATPCSSLTKAVLYK
jgi:Flp pilus assembly protein TadG